MFIIIQLQFQDGMKEDYYIFVEIWKRNNDFVIKVLVMEKEVVFIVIDLYLEIVDID